MIHGPAGSGKSALTELLLLVALQHLEVTAPTNGARRAQQQLVDRVLPRKSLSPTLEVMTTFRCFGVGMKGSWTSESILEDINSSNPAKAKARAFYSDAERLVLDEGGQTPFYQTDVADAVSQVKRSNKLIMGGIKLVVLLDGVQTPAVLGDESSQGDGCRARDVVGRRSLLHCKVYRSVGDLYTRTSVSNAGAGAT